MPVPAPQPPVSRALLRDDVYLRVRDAIVDGTLAPGEQLRDQELAAWLGVSRTPVREALLRLQQAGLVTSLPGRSTTVASLDTRAARDAQAVVAQLHRLAVHDAVGLLTADDLTRMRAANERFRAALEAGDADGALAADDELHGIPVAAAGNAALAAVLDQLTPVLRRVERLRFSSLSGRGSVALHARLIDLCEAGERDAAAEVSHQTWQTLAPLLDTWAARDAQAVVAQLHRLAVHDAVGLLTADDLTRMRAANDRFRAALEAGDADGALAADDELHGIPVAAAGNAALAAVLDQFTPVLRRVERLRFSSLSGRGSVALHARLIDLCEAGDRDAAAEVSHQTWQTLAPLLDT